MPSSDTPAQVEPALPITVTAIVPESAYAENLISEAMHDFERPAAWPINPYGPDSHPRFARAVFPRSAFVGPIPFLTAGLCGLAPVLRNSCDDMLNLKASDNQNLPFSDALAALVMKHSAPSAAAPH